ncbi:MAG: GDP-mannose 4,6-dehydratase, partial [Chlamydiia bacterium]|nr:GDP-mannose 4,6-dehydratase [Chlamydiia bacterium]
MENQKETMFITGIAGFIGFHLASLLIKKEYYVIGCDNFNHYYSPDLKKMRADKLISQGAKIINEDIQNLSSVPKNVTHIIHLAAQAGVRYSLTHPKPYIDSNLNGFLNILELCKDRPEIKLIFAS